MKKTLSLVLVLAMLCTALLGVSSFAAEESTEPQLEITQANLKFEETVYLLVAVNYASAYSTLADAQANVTLKITNDATGEVYNLSPDSSIALGGHVCFTLTELGAKNMGDQLSIQAYNKGVASGKSATYSILEYALKARGTSGDSFDAVLDAMLAYGAAAREVYNHAPKANSYDLTKNYGIVVVNGSNEGKVIAEVGSDVSFTSKIANSVLYDMSLNPVTGSLSVTAGSSRYFYIGDTQKNALNLDADTFSLSGNVHFIDNTGGTELLTASSKNIYTSATNTGTTTAISGTRNQISLRPTSANPGEVAGFAVENDANGRKALAWSISTTSAIFFAVMNPAGNVGYTAGDKFTVSFTLGSSDTFLFSGFRLRGSAGNGDYFWNIQTSGDGWNIRSQDNTVLRHIGKNSTFTMHVVFDLGAKTMTYYTDTGVVYTQAISATNYSNATGTTSPYFDWTCYRKASLYTQCKSYIYDFVVYNGNIFE